MPSIIPPSNTNYKYLTCEIDEFTRTGAGPMSSTGIQAAAFLTSEVAKRKGQGNWPDIQYLLLGTGVYPRQEVDTSRSFNIRPGRITQFDYATT